VTLTGQLIQLANQKKIPKMKNIILFFLVLFSFSAFGQSTAPNIGKDRKDVYTLWRQAYSKRAGVDMPVLKLLPVVTDSASYMNVKTGKAADVRGKYAELTRGMFDYDPNDSTTLAIMIDATVLGAGLDASGVIDYVQADSLFQDIYVSGDDICFVTNNGTDTTCIAVPSTADGSETKVTVSDNQSINFSISGAGTTASPYIVTGAVIPSSATDNRLKSLAGGLYVAPQDTFSLVNYDAGNGAHVWATGAGVTFSKNTATGEYTFAIPDGVELVRAQVKGASGDGDAGGEIYAIFNYSGTRTYNQSRQTAWTPRATIMNGAAASPSRVAPHYVDLNLVYGLSAVSGGDLELTLQNAESYFSAFVIQFDFL